MGLVLEIGTGQESLRRQWENKSTLGFLEQFLCSLRFVLAPMWVSQKLNNAQNELMQHSVGCHLQLRYHFELYFRFLKEPGGHSN